MVLKSDLPVIRTRLRNRLKILQRRIRSIEGRSSPYISGVKTKLQQDLEALKQEYDRVRDELYK